MKKQRTAQAPKPRNPVKKHMDRFYQSSAMQDKKKYSRKEKHKGASE